MDSSTSIERQLRTRWVLLGLILLVSAAAKIPVMPGTGPFGWDGSFYVNAARNVYEGHGPVTSVSLYHRGEMQLPAPSRAVYPLFVLLMGYTGRIIGFVNAVNVLPPFFYLLDILLIYLVGERLSRRLGIPDDTGWLRPGHLLALLLAANYQFFGPTTYPYTESLGFFLAFLTLLLVDRAPEGRPVFWGALTGVSAGLALLARTQLVIVGLAVLLAMAWVTLSDRRFFRATASMAVVYGGFLAILYFVVYHHHEGPTVPLESSFKMWNEPQSTGAWLLKRLEGVAVSVSVLSPYSYFKSFHTSFLLPLIGLPLALLAWARTRPRSWKTPVQWVMPAACFSIACAAYVSLNLFNSDETFFVPWLFGYRHGLPIIFAIVLGAVFFWGKGRWGRVFVTAAILIAVLLNLPSIVSMITRPKPSSPSRAEAELGRWLDSHPRTPLLISARAQHLSIYTHANIHWTECRTEPLVTRKMLKLLPVDYVVVYPSERRCAFLKGLGDVLVVKAAFGAGGEQIHVLGRRGRPGLASR
jgi:hypothetical protein